MTIYIDMAIAVAFSLRLGRGGFHHGDLMRGSGSRCEMEGGILPPTLSRGSNPFEHDLAIYDCATEDANHSYAFKRTTVCQRGLASRKNGAQLCYDYAKKGQCSRAHRAGSDTSPRDGIGIRKCGGKSHKKTMLDSFGSRNLAR